MALTLDSPTRSQPEPDGPGSRHPDGVTWPITTPVMRPSEQAVIGNKKLRVLVCDDHRVVRAGLVRILGQDPEFDVVADVGSVREAVAVADREQPDVVIMDLTLPDGSGIAAIKSIAEVSPATRSLVLTMHEDIAYVRESFGAGAAGYLVKAAADVELLEAVRVVGAGRRYLYPALGAALLRDRPAERRSNVVPGLSDREREVLGLLALGHTNVEMAGLLGLSARTVETYRCRMQQRVGLRSRADLARLARDHGLVS